MTALQKAKRAGLWFGAGFIAGVIVRGVHATHIDIDDARDSERITRADVDASVADLRDIVDEIRRGVDVSRERLDRAEEAADTIERGAGYIRDGIDGVRHATEQLRAIMDRAQDGC